MKYEMIAGLEVHAELKTKTKIFCSCDASYGGPPNTQVCPICLGMPGTLPVLNREAVRLGIAAGLVTNCSIASVSGFDRKSYFYPDLPKGYQITQYEAPICRDGYLDVMTSAGNRRIGIIRIHLEEDAGKLQHSEAGTKVDYNRCGIPLIEIVSEPEIRSAEEAKAYLQALRERLVFAGISDCRMNEGSMRCDVNLSVRACGSDVLGTRTEIKNINSIAFVGRAIEYEFARQVRILEEGGTVMPETRRYDEAKDETVLMRVKESAADYRYLPEPDLPQIRVEDDDVAAVWTSLPVMPDAYRFRWQAEYGVSTDDARLLSATPERARYFSEAAAGTKWPKHASNLLIGTLLPAYGEDEIALPAGSLAKIADMVGERTVSAAAARRLVMLCTDGSDPFVRAREENMLPITDRAELVPFVMEAIRTNRQAAEQILAGKEKAKQVLIGSVMRLSGGRADTAVLAAVIDEELKHFAEENKISQET